MNPVLILKSYFIKTFGLRPINLLLAYKRNNMLLKTKFKPSNTSYLILYYSKNGRQYSYCHALGDRRRVLDWQLDLLQSYTQVQYN
jgi:hypothetical protein